MSSLDWTLARARHEVGRRRIAADIGARENPSRGFEPPHPLGRAVVLLAPVPLLVALWLAGPLPAPAALGFAVTLVHLAVILGVLGALDLRRSRRLADALLRRYPGQPPVSGLAAWRSGELTSPRSRRELTRLVRRLRRETEACLRWGGPPVERGMLDEILVLLRRLERRLESASAPVSPLGMLELRALAGEEFSPLYFPERAGGLPVVLAHLLAGLEPS